MEISKALKKGDAKVLANYFDNTIDLSFSDKTNNYSKKQALLILQKFFSKIEPSNYATNQRGTSNFNNSKYYIGNLSTSNGVYKVYMFFIYKSNQYFLKELRFEK